MSFKKWSLNAEYALLEFAKVFFQVDLSRFSKSKNASAVC